MQRWNPPCTGHLIKIVFTSWHKPFQNSCNVQIAVWDSFFFLNGLPSTLSVLGTVPARCWMWRAMPLEPDYSSTLWTALPKKRREQSWVTSGWTKTYQFLHLSTRHSLRNEADMAVQKELRRLCRSPLCSKSCWHHQWPCDLFDCELKPLFNRCVGRGWAVSLQQCKEKVRKCKTIEIRNYYCALGLFEEAALCCSVLTRGLFLLQSSIGTQ